MASDLANNTPAIPDVEKGIANGNKSETSLHSPTTPAGSDHEEHVSPVMAAGGEEKPLEKQMSKEVMERSKLATGLIMFSLCVSMRVTA
jgi:hypothetical protein